MTYAYNPAGRWTSRHQMSVAGRVDDFTVDDLRSCANTASMSRGSAERILAEITSVVGEWPRFSADAGVDAKPSAAIGRTHRLRLPAA